MSQEDIKKAIIDQLYWDSRIDANDVHVTVTGSEVTLTGTVPSYSARTAAIDDAWLVPDVTMVRDDLRVAHPSTITLPTDNEVKSNIEQILAWDSDIDASQIDVRVDRGWVTLQGNESAYWKKLLIEEHVSRISGVTGITNEISITPTGAVADAMIGRDVEAALERNVLIPVNAIDVIVEDGIVTLRGTVPNRAAERAAHNIAQYTFGVTEVRNELVVQSLE